MLPTQPVEGARRTTLVIVACILVIATVVAVRSLIAPMLLGACVGAMVSPWMQRLRRFGPKRAAAALVAATVLCVALPIAMILVPVVSEARAIAALLKSGSVVALHPQIGDNLVGSPQALFHELRPRIAEALPSVIGAASEIALGVFVFFMTLYYALVDGERAMAFVRRITPLEARHFNALTREFVVVGRAVLVSVVLTALVEGGTAGIVYFAVGLKSAALLTVLTAIAALVPIGTVLVWGPLAAMLYVQGRPFAATVIAFTGAVVISGLDHFARPQLARVTRARIHPLLVFVGMFGGMASLGGWGLFAGPLLVALGMAALRLWDREQRARALVTAALVPPITMPPITVPQITVIEPAKAAEAAEE